MAVAEVAPSPSAPAQNEPELRCIYCEETRRGVLALAAHFIADHGVDSEFAQARAAEVGADSSMHARTLRPKPLRSVAAAPASVGLLRCPYHQAAAAAAFPVEKSYRLIDHFVDVHDLDRDEAMRVVERIEGGEVVSLRILPASKLAEASAPKPKPRRHGPPTMGAEIQAVMELQKRNGSGRPLSEDVDLRQAAKLREQGKSWGAIAKELGVSRDALQHHRKRAGQVATRAPSAKTGRALPPPTRAKDMEEPTMGPMDAPVRCETCPAMFVRTHGRQRKCPACQAKPRQHRASSATPAVTTPKCGYCHRDKDNHLKGCRRAPRAKSAKGGARVRGRIPTPGEPNPIVARIKEIHAEMTKLTAELVAIRAALDEPLPTTKKLRD